MQSGILEFEICDLTKTGALHRPTAAQAMQHKWILHNLGKRGKNQRVRHGKRRSQTFKSYMGMKKLKKAALGHLAAHLNPTEIEHLGKVFKSIHKEDESGSVTLKELDTALTSEGFSRDLLQRLRNLREDLSLTGDERVNWKDFLDAMMDKSLLLKEDKIRLAFDLFRKRENHSLRLDELYSVLGGEKATRDIIDIDHLRKQGFVSYEEFKDKLTCSFTEVEFEEIV